MKRFQNIFFYQQAGSIGGNAGIQYRLCFFLLIPNKFDRIEYFTDCSYLTIRFVYAMTLYGIVAAEGSDFCGHFNRINYTMVDVSFQGR